MKYLLSVFVAVFMIGTMGANAQEDGIKKIIDSDVAKWINNDAIISAVNAQNAEHASLLQGDIDALDKKWRAEGGSGDLTDKVLGNGLSQFLVDIKEKSEGLYTEIFVMDNKGLNVGQSDATSDYWQGDEGKWQKTFLVGAGALDISEVEFDESAQIYQVQVSLSIVSDGKVIGAITIGMNAEFLE